MSGKPIEPAEASDHALSPPLSVELLLARTDAGERFAYLMFWGHRPRADGRVSAACFSQWYPAEFSVDGLRYATSEHWMMAEKARLFGDDAAVAKMLAKDGRPRRGQGSGPQRAQLRRCDLGARPFRCGGPRQHGKIFRTPFAA
jgi:NADAR domain